MRKVLLFVYDSFAEFEISILITCLNGSDYDLHTCSITEAPVISAGRLSVQANITVENVNPDNYEALIIPGGAPHGLFHIKPLITLIKDFYNKGKLIGAICGGPSLLGPAGVLDEIKYTASLTRDDEEYQSVLNWENKIDEYLVVDKNVVTATGSNYVNFAEEVLRQLAIFSQDEKEPLLYFKEPSLS